MKNDIMGKDYQRMGFGKHGGGNSCGCYQERLQYGPAQINTLLKKVESVNWLMDNLLNIHNELKKALDDFVDKGKKIDGLEQNAKEALMQLLNAIVSCESRLNLLENNITNVVELNNNGLVPSDVIARYIQAYTQQFANEDQLGAIDDAVALLSQSLNIVAATANNAIQRSKISVPNGVASLGPDGKVPASQLPNFVEGIVECCKYGDDFYRPVVNGKIKPNATISDFNEATLVVPDEKHMYNDVNTSKLYRWGGTAYVEISASPGTTDEVAEGSNNKYYTEERVLAAMAGHTDNSDIHVTASDKQAWSGKYTKPSGGIPSTDLAVDIRNSLTKANSALQSYCVTLDAITMDDFIGTYPTGTYSKSVAGLYNEVNSIAEAGKMPFLVVLLTGHTAGYRIPVWRNNNGTFEGWAVAGNGTYIVRVNIFDNDTINVTTTGYYSKPTGGIPESDLSQALREKLAAQSAIAGYGNSIPSSAQSSNLPIGAVYMRQVPGDSGITAIPIWWTGLKWVDAFGNEYSASDSSDSGNDDYYYYSEIGSDDYYYAEVGEDDE